MQFGLTDKQLEILKNIFSNYTEVSEVVIYGSRAKGTYNDRSDIDLVIKNSNVDRKLINKIRMNFDESNIPYLIDLKNYNTIKSTNLLQEIDNYGQVVYKA